MSDFCTIIAKGRLTREPDYRHTPAGSSVCELGMAWNRKGRNNQDEPVFVDVVAWGKLADACHNNLAKGSSILVRGYLAFERWQSRDGKNCQKHKIIAEELVFMPSGKKENSYSEPVAQTPVAQEYAPPRRQAAFYGDTPVAAQKTPVVVTPVVAADYSDDPKPDDIPF